MSESRSVRAILGVGLCVAGLSCAGELEEAPPAAEAPHAGFVLDAEGSGSGEVAEEAGVGGALKGLSPSSKVEDAVYGTCTTASIRALSDQLMAEVSCLRPGVLERIDGVPNVALGGAVVPWLQAPAAKALRRAAAQRSLTLNSATRTLPQQYLLYRWYQAGRCGISLAAPPGSSNHESGLAVDVDNYSAARSALGGQSFRWLGGNDPVHFDYVGGGTVDLRSLSVLAFQRLWNHSNPSDRIAADGAWGAETAQRLSRAPIGGFSKGSTCAPAAPPPEERPSNLAAMGVGWERGASGAYTLSATAPSSVVRVEYFVDGYKIAGVTRAASPTFAASYTFQEEGEGRLVEAVGLDSRGAQVALGEGALDVTAGVAVFIRQQGAGVYEIGLERAPDAVAAIEVDADGWPLTDGVSGERRATRRAVKVTLNQGGERRFELRTYSADGSYRGTLRRTLEVRP